MSIATGASDPSVGEDADTSPRCGVGRKYCYIPPR